MDLRDFQLLQDHQGHRQVPFLLCYQGDRLFQVAQGLLLVPSILADRQGRLIQLVPRNDEEKRRKRSDNFYLSLPAKLIEPY